MKKLIHIAIVVGGLVMYGAAQEADDMMERGAKAVFADKTRFAPKSNSVRKDHMPSRVPDLPRSTGLMYWIELVLPGSPEVQRVTSTRAFHSGERIRLHFESNIDGRIALMQMTPSGVFEVLFPSSRVRNGDNHIKAATDMILPAENAWFTFDNHPGIEQIMVLLTPEPDIPSVSQRSADAVAPKPEPQHPAERGAPRDQDSERGAVAKALTSSAGQKLASNETKALLSHFIRSLGSKSLVLETDESSKQPAQYAAQVINHEKNKTSDALAIRIELKHL